MGALKIQQRVASFVCEEEHNHGFHLLLQRIFTWKKILMTSISETSMLGLVGLSIVS